MVAYHFADYSWSELVLWLCWGVFTGQETLLLRGQVGSRARCLDCQSILVLHWEFLHQCLILKQYQYIVFCWWHLHLMPWWCLALVRTIQWESCREEEHISYPLLACELMHTPGDLVRLESLYLMERWPQDPVNVDFTKQVHLVELASACLQASYSSLLEFQSKYILGLCMCQLQESLNVCLHLLMVVSVWFEHNTGASAHY